MPQQVGKFDFSGIPQAGQSPDFEGIPRAAAQPPAPEDEDMLLANLKAVGNVGLGALKGAARTTVGLGRLAGQSHMIPGVGEIPVGAERAMGLDPSTPGQSIGAAIEHLLEFLIPGSAPEKAAATLAAHTAPLLGRAAPLVGRAVAEAVPAGVITAAQGGDPVTGGAVAAASAGLAPLAAKGVKAAGEYIGGWAEPLVRAAIKPTVTDMKRQAGASMTGINAQAKRLSKFILDNGITTVDKAEQIIVQSEKDLKALFATGQYPMTDAPDRAMRYLNALERSAQKQALPAADVAAIRQAGAELLKDSGLSEDVVKTVMKPSPSGLVDASGKPVMAPTQETSRALRTDVAADEALDIARASGKWGNKKQWGEQKGASVEAGKTVERGLRDSVKAAVPEAKPILQQQGQAIATKSVLDRAEFRAANRDAVSLPAHVVAAGEIARGKIPLLAFAANWLRNNQLKAGVWAQRLEKAIQRKDVEGTTEIMRRLGVSAVDRQPVPATSDR